MPAKSRKGVSVHVPVLADAEARKSEGEGRTDRKLACDVALTPIGALRPTWLPPSHSSVRASSSSPAPSSSLPDGPSTREPAPPYAEAAASEALRGDDWAGRGSCEGK